MLESMRTLAEKKIFKAIMVLVVVSFIIAGVGDIFKKNDYDTIAVIDNKYKISTSEYNLALQNEVSRLQNSFGVKLTPDQINQLNVKNNILNQIINSKILEIESNSLNLKIDDESIVNYIKSLPFFQDDKGNFDRAKFDYILQSNHLSEAKYTNLIKKELGSKFLMDVITAQSLNQELFLPYYYQFENQERIVDLIILNPKDLAKSSEPTDVELKTYYDDNAQLFMEPEYRSFKYLELKSQDIAPEISISENDLKKEFEESAQEYSNIKFEDAKASIKNKLISQKIDNQLYETMQKIEDDLASGSNIEEISEKYQLKLKSEDSINQDRSTSVDKEVLDIVFSLSDQDEPIVRIKSDHSSFYVVKLTKITNSAVKAFDKAKEFIKVKWQETTMQKQALDIAKNIAKDLSSGKTIKEIAYKTTANNNYLVKKDNNELPAKLVSNIFNLKINQTSEVAKNKDSLVIAILKEINNKEVNQQDPKYESIANQLKSDFTNEITQQYLDYLHKKHKITINDKVLKL